MDRDVTVRFYEIEHAEMGLSFAETLNVINGLTLLDRQALAGDGITIRLEELRSARGLMFGDFTRVQTSNLPSYPTPTSTDPLPIDQLGFHSAFCFDPTTNIIALQFDMKMAVGRICTYARSFGQGTHFQPVPVLREGMLDEFERETPTKFKFRVAQVHRFVDSVSEPADFERAIAGFAERFDGHAIEIKISTRRSNGGLEKDSVLDAVRKLLRRRNEFGGVQAITAETAESADPFDFIKALLKMNETLDLPENDPTAGRDMRVDFVRECFEQHLSYFRTRYVPVQS